MADAIDFWILTGDGRRHWVARFYDQGDAQFYAGEGATPWEAIAWSLDEREHRRRGIVRMAQNPGAKPTLDVSAQLVASAQMTEADRVVRLPLAEAPCTKSKSAAARRARSKKSAKPGASH